MHRGDTRIRAIYWHRITRHYTNQADEEGLQETDFGDMITTLLQTSIVVIV